MLRMEFADHGHLLRQVKVPRLQPEWSCSGLKQCCGAGHTLEIHRKQTYSRL